jgi:hypothetical protein
MKKYFAIPLMAAAVMGMAACSQDDELAEQGGALGQQAIRFDAPVVNKATRGVITAKTEIGYFDVYGFNGSEQVFNGDEVTVSATDASCSYSNLRYWTEGTYNFYAICWGDGKSDSADGVTRITPAVDNNSQKVNLTDYQSDGQSDLMFAKATNQTATESRTAAVDLTFKHQLAKVRFKFTSTTSKEVKLSNVSISDIYDKGNVQLDDESPVWSSLSKSADSPSLSFALKADDTNSTSTLGDDGVLTLKAVDENLKDASDQTLSQAEGSSEEMLLIPVNLDAEDNIALANQYKVTFTVKVGETENTVTKYLRDINLEAGKAYNLNVSLGYNAIDFTVDVTAFDTTDEDAAELKAKRTLLYVSELYDRMMKYNVRKVTFDSDGKINGVSAIYEALNYGRDTEDVFTPTYTDGSKTEGNFDEDPEYISYNVLEKSGLTNPEFAGLTYDGKKYRLPSGAEIHLLLPYWNSGTDYKFPYWSYENYSAFAELPDEKVDENVTSINANAYRMVSQDLTNQAANSYLKKGSVDGKKVVYGLRFVGTAWCSAYRWEYAEDPDNAGKYYLDIKIKQLGSATSVSDDFSIDTVASEDYWTGTDGTDFYEFQFPASGYYRPNTEDYYASQPATTLQSSGTSGYVWSSSRTAGSAAGARYLNFYGSGARARSLLTGHRFPLRLVRAD